MRSARGLRCPRGIHADGRFFRGRKKFPSKKSSAVTMERGRWSGGVVEWWSGGLLACPLNPVWDARATHSGTGYSLCHFTLRARRDVLKGLLARAFPRKKMQVMARVHSLFIDVLAFASLTCSLDLSGRNRQEKVRHSYGPKGPPRSRRGKKA